MLFSRIRRISFRRSSLVQLFTIIAIMVSVQSSFAAWQLSSSKSIPCNSDTTLTLQYLDAKQPADIAGSGTLWLVGHGTAEIHLPETVPYDSAMAAIPLFIRGEGAGEIQVYDDIRKSTGILEFHATNPGGAETPQWIPRISIEGDDEQFVVSANLKATATLTLSNGTGPMPPTAHIKLADHRGRVVSSRFYSTFDLAAELADVQFPVAGQYQVTLKLLNDAITSLPSSGMVGPEKIPFGKTAADFDERQLLPDGVTTQTVVGVRVALEHIPTSATVVAEDRVQVVALARPSRQIQKNQWPFVIVGADLISMSLADQKEKGLRLVRWQRRLGSSFAPVTLEWETIQKSPGHLRWSSLNSVLPIYRKAIVRPLVTLIGKSAWSQELPTETSATLSSWTEFTRQLSKNHRELIWGLQCWDYPEDTWPDSKLYGQLVNATLDGFQMPDKIKAPTPPVIVGGTRQFDPAYLEPLLTSNTLDRISGISFHLFPRDKTSSPEKNGFDKILISASEFIKTKKSKSLDLWITGTGWPNGPAGVTEKVQANYLVRTHVMAIAHGAYKLYWNSLMDKPDLPWASDGTAPMGLLDSRLFPKPSGVAYNLMTYMMSGVEALETTKQGNVIIYKFNIPLQNNKWRGILYVAWTESPGTQDIRLEMTHGGGVYALDYLGAEIQTRKVIEDSANSIKGTYSFPVGFEPVFIWDAGGPTQTK